MIRVNLNPNPSTTRTGTLILTLALTLTQVFLLPRSAHAREGSTVSLYGVGFCVLLI